MIKKYVFFKLLVTHFLKFVKRMDKKNNQHDKMKIIIFNIFIVFYLSNYPLIFSKTYNYFKSNILFDELIFFILIVVLVWMKFF